jgi:hypothetical protein
LHCVLNQGEQAFDGWSVLCAAMAEDTSAVNKDLKFPVGMTHFRADPIFRSEFALKAPGQASLVSSNQAPTDLDFCLVFH